MEFKLENFVESPTLKLFNQCKKDNLLLIVDQYAISLSKQLKKQDMKKELCDALVDKGIFQQVQSVPASAERSKQPFDEVMRLKELELESQHLALKDELKYLNDLEMKRLEHEYRFCELEICRVSTGAAHFIDF